MNTRAGLQEKEMLVENGLDGVDSGAAGVDEKIPVEQNGN